MLGADLGANENFLYFCSYMSYVRIFHITKKR